MYRIICRTRVPNERYVHIYIQGVSTQYELFHGTCKATDTTPMYNNLPTIIDEGVVIQRFEKYFHYLLTIKFKIFIPSFTSDKNMIFTPECTPVNAVLLTKISSSGGNEWGNMIKMVKNDGKKLIIFSYFLQKTLENALLTFVTRNVPREFSKKNAGDKTNSSTKVVLFFLFSFSFYLFLSTVQIINQRNFERSRVLF